MRLIGNWLFTETLLVSARPMDGNAASLVEEELNAVSYEDMVVAKGGKIKFGWYPDIKRISRKCYGFGFLYLLRSEK